MSSKPDTAIATRTLIAAGFTVLGAERHGTHIEIDCSHADFLGVTVHYRVAVFDADEPPAADLSRIYMSSRRDNKVSIVVAAAAGEGWLRWADFLDALGGAVPSWRALDKSFGSTLLTLAKNQPVGEEQGEPWLDFEDATADAFEFMLGQPVSRLGGRRRGKKVSDLLAQMPDRRILVMDTKAYRDPFDASSGSLRPLQEYTARQVARQRGTNEVAGAILVANEFKQDELGLVGIAGDFLVQSRMPLTFMRAGTLVRIVESVTKNVILRSAVRWPTLLCRGGLLQNSAVDSEIADALAERRA